MIKLVTGTNKEGYDITLDQLTEEMNASQDTPSRSAFSQFRRSISYLFFEHIFQTMILGWFPDRPKWKNLYVTSIDGDSFLLPASDELLKEGFRGRPCKGNRETYYPTGYFTCATDVISGCPIDFDFSTTNNEISAALRIINRSQFTENTLTLFDRFYLSSELLTHYQFDDAGYYLVRCKKRSTFKEIAEFVESPLEDEVVIIDGDEVRLVRYRHAGSNEDIIFATNLPRSFKKDDIGYVYSRRWESETGNRERSTTMKIEQFHARNLNGIMQEIYATVIVQAIARIVSTLETQNNEELRKEPYELPNIKSIIHSIGRNAYRLLILKCKDSFDRLLRLAKIGKEWRERYSRSYPRKLRRVIGNLYDHQSLIKRRTASVQ